MVFLLGRWAGGRAGVGTGVPGLSGAGPGRINCKLATLTCPCGQRHRATPAEHACTAGTPWTWFEDRILRLMSSLRDFNGRMSSHSFLEALVDLCESEPQRASHVPWQLLGLTYRGRAHMGGCSLGRPQLGKTAPPTASPHKPSATRWRSFKCASSPSPATNTCVQGKRVLARGPSESNVLIRPTVCALHHQLPDHLADAPPTPSAAAPCPACGTVYEDVFIDGCFKLKHVASATGDATLIAQTIFVGQDVVNAYDRVRGLQSAGPVDRTSAAP